MQILGKDDGISNIDRGISNIDGISNIEPTENLIYPPEKCLQ